MKKFLSLCALFLCAAPAFAAPTVITATSSSTAVGSVVTIQSSGAGSKSPSKPYYANYFLSGSTTADLFYSQTSSAVIQQTDWATPFHSISSTDSVFSGTSYVLKMSTFPDSGGTDGAIQIPTTLTPLTTTFLCVSRKRSWSWNAAAGGGKYIRCSQNAGVGQPDWFFAYSNNYGNGTINTECTNVTPTQGIGAYAYSTGTATFERWIQTHGPSTLDQSTNTVDNGTFDLWMNGNRVATTNTMLFCEMQQFTYFIDNYLDTNDHPTMPNQINAWETQSGQRPYYLLSNIYFDTTHTKVELSSCSDYTTAQSGRLVPAPALSWNSDGSGMTVMIPPSDLSGTLYVYVTDAQNNVNATGTQVTISVPAPTLSMGRGYSVNLRNILVPNVAYTGAKRFGTYIGGGLGLNAVSQSTWAADLSSCSVLGIGIVRGNTDTWDVLEPSTGNFDWSRLDVVVSSAQALGIDLLFTIPISNSWNQHYSTGETHAANGTFVGPTAFPTPDLNSVRRFCNAIATRYKGKIRAYEVWNEPDLWVYWKNSTNTNRNASEYYAFISTAYVALKGADPNALVMMGGIAAPLSPDFLSAFLSTGGAQYTDAINIHVYNETFLLNSVMAVVRSTEANYGVSKPVWITETSNTSGYFVDTDTPTHEHTKSVYLVKNYAYAMTQPDIQVIFWHTLRGLGADVGVARDYDFSLMTSTFGVLPAFNALTAYNTLVKHSRVLDFRNSGCFRYSKFETPANVVYEANSVGGTTTLNIPAHGTFYDQWGTVITTTAIQSEPVYLTIPKQHRKEATSFEQSICQ